MHASRETYPGQTSESRSQRVALVESSTLFDRGASLLFSPWRWMTPRAKAYKALLFAVGLAILVPVCVAVLSGPPRVHRAIGIFVLLAMTSTVALAWRRWNGEEELDLPREWIARVSP